MAAILFEIEPGDEVILPSFTFVSTANAFVLRGGRSSLCRHPARYAEPRRASAGDGAYRSHPRGRASALRRGRVRDGRYPRLCRCERLKVVEDAAQGYLATWNGRPLGSMGHLGALSLHATKNVVAGEGGLLVINDVALEQRAQIIREKGTNRTAFERREVVKYEWLNIGSSFLPSDLVAAVLLAQLEAAKPLPRIGGRYGRDITIGSRRRNMRAASGGRSYPRKRKPTAISII
jgi:dTDP-4-amino-4,6-dideoxygalactose transaminase